MTDPEPGEVAYRALQREARTTGRTTQELLELYALEGVLARRRGYRNHIVWRTRSGTDSFGSLVESQHRHLGASRRSNTPKGNTIVSWFHPEKEFRFGTLCE